MKKELGIVHEKSHNFYAVENKKTISIYFGCFLLFLYLSAGLTPFSDRQEVFAVCLASTQIRSNTPITRNLSLSHLTPKGENNGLEARLNGKVIQFQVPV